MESDQCEPGNTPAILRKGGHRHCDQSCAKRAMQQKVVVFGIERRLDAAARVSNPVHNQSEPIRIGKDSCQSHSRQSRKLRVVFAATSQLANRCVSGDMLQRSKSGAGDEWSWSGTIRTMIGAIGSDKQIIIRT